MSPSASPQGIAGAASGALPTGRIVAFDKHMNVVIQDVAETYTVRKMVYKERIDAMRPVLESRTRSIANCPAHGSEHRVDPVGHSARDPANP